MVSFIKSFHFAFRGLRFAWEGRNFRVQFGAAIAVIALGIFLDISRVDWLVLSIIIGLVLAFEAMNSALENLVDLVSPEMHPIAGRVKDLAAAAVLVLSIVSVGIGLLVFWPYLRVL